MKNVLLAAILASGLASCTGLPEIEPIPGSLTYKGQPPAKEVTGSVGSTIQHKLKNEYGQSAEEFYVIQPDRTLRLVRRDTEGEQQGILPTSSNR
jgi:hypothetical protein